MKTEPQKEHQWLDKLVGKWIFEADCSMGPDQPASKSKGSESVRSLGGLWVLCEGECEMPDCGSVTTMMTLGYDSKRKRYVGTWIGSMMAYLWMYDGAMDPAGKVLTLNAEGPNMCAEGKMANYKDVIEFKGNDHRVLTSHVQGDDGKWQQFLTANYRRER